MPSLYEGFGFPALEAMAQSCPTALAKTSSLWEIGKEASCFFEPLSVLAIKEVLDRLINDSQLRKDLAAKGKQKVQQFSWENTAWQILTVIKQK
jgi:glycosyltransferase involved in cell wall biosynthesis